MFNPSYFSISLRQILILFDYGKNKENYILNKKYIYTHMYFAKIKLGYLLVIEGKNQHTCTFESLFTSQLGICPAFYVYTFKLNTETLKRNFRENKLLAILVEKIKYLIK